MKKNIQLFIGFILLALCGNVYSQEVRVVEQFSKLYVNGYFNVELIKDKKPGIELVFEDVDSDKIITEVKKGELVIKHKYPFTKGYKVTVKVKYTTLEEIDANYNSVIKFSEIPLVLQKLKVSAGTDSEIFGKIDIVDLKVSCHEGSTVQLFGIAKYQDISALTGGIIKNFGLKSEVIKASVSTGGKANVFVTEKMDASVSTGGHLNFMGKPNIKDISTILGGSYKELDESQINNQ